MAAKTLQLANSAFMGVRGEISSLQQAVSVIGTDMIRSLALSVHVFTQFERSSSAAAYIPALWEHSVKVASLARHIARHEGQSKTLGEQSFTAGLLHDIGKAILLSEIPDAYRPIVQREGQNPDSFQALEIEHLGCTHAQVGAYLMSVWGLPASLVHAVALHHSPMDDKQARFSPLTAVHCADAIANATGPSTFNHDGELNLAYLERLTCISHRE